jgi:hypothetical protein
MTVVEVQNIRKGISFITDTKGAKTGVLINLRNKQTKELFEDFLDTLTIIERQDELTRPFAEVDAEIMSIHKLASCTK